ncbi:hypothetical protein [Streptomyces sedi]|uniref:Uncharacterized protein n=1 Tax=Streptomyces sedi TaxID=555059 RepID=A0A5C4VDG0_9ACTN|nr:hypothetical protein [Streptomyces sedi]TNM33585.1 hypothetical protein FH715_04345 [Streptomyces sedi]
MDQSTSSESPTPSPPPAALRAFVDRVALWRIRFAWSDELVAAACDALVAGLDSPALCRLAGLSRREVDYEIPLLIPEVLGELGLCAPQSDPRTDAAALRALAALTVRGELSPGRFVAETQGLLIEDPKADGRLAELCGAYGWAEWNDVADHAALDAGALAEARRLAEL